MDRMQPVSPGRAPRMPAPSGANGNGNSAIVGDIIAAEQALTARFPDLQRQMDYPSLMRVGYDVFATDSTARITFAQMLDLFIEGAGSMDPARDIRADVFDRVVNHLQHVLFRAYASSPTFRRLFNYAVDTHLRETRWGLAAGEALGTTVTEEQRQAAGNRSVIALNCDPFEANPDPDVYACAEGVHPFSGDRSYVHEIAHALTGITDREEAHPRGAVVEYENLIMKEMGEDSPARIAYELPPLPQDGVEEVDFSSIDFGDALNAGPPP
jgi:PipA/GogA/GtgA family effector protease